MRYLADESVERQIVDALRRAGHDVDYIAELAPGAADPDVLKRANLGSSVLITGDKGLENYKTYCHEKNIEEMSAALVG